MTPALLQHPRLHLDLACDHAAANRARAATSRFLHEAADRSDRSPAVSPPAEDAALLIVTELVTNAVRHTAGPCTLDLALHEEGLDIDVTDGSPEQPVTRPPHVEGTGGWGWILIRHLAREVTVHPTRTGGKTVHACLTVAAA
ncbi:ATP-binding protein [Streptomyces sp. NPDC001568]|uniref:ATP-binding protein n=1 Tax=Streptomyces sp. NPDC001568 TaxID=3364588 RepID=UPI003691986C